MNPRTTTPSVSSIDTTLEVLIQALRIRSVVDSHAAAAVARRAALTAGFASTGAQCVAIAASELATNIARHAREGTITLYRSLEYVKLVAEDRGPGFVDIEAALADRCSGGRQLSVDDARGDGIGCGLGAVRRLMDSLKIQSTPGTGTLIVAIKYRTRGQHA